MKTFRTHCIEGSEAYGLVQLHEGNRNRLDCATATAGRREHRIVLFTVIYALLLSIFVLLFHVYKLK